MNESKDVTFASIYSQMKREIIDDLSKSNIPLNDIAIQAEMTSEAVSELLAPTSDHGDYLAYRTLNSTVKKLIHTNFNTANRPPKK